MCLPFKGRICSRSLRGDDSDHGARVDRAGTALHGTLGHLLLFLLGLLVAFPVQAERTLKSDSKDRIDAVILLDSSGSMRLTDPERLRDEGAKLFTQFLSSSDRLAVIEFAERPTILRPLSSFTKESEAELASQLAQIENNGYYTDISAAIRLAKKHLDANPREGAGKAIVLLSDGKMDPDPSRGSGTLLTDTLLQEFLPELKAEEVKIHTLAFSEQADKGLLSQIAVATEGVNWFTPTADQIHESFADLFLVVKKPQVLPMTGKGFRIDAGVSEATFYINMEELDPEMRDQVSVTSPEGTLITANETPEGVKWFEGQKFNVITIPKPEIGNWQVHGLPSSDGFATVLTDIKLITDWPNNVRAGADLLLQAQLHEDEKPIVLPEMSGVSKYGFQITPTDKVSEPIIKALLTDDGKNGDKIARDGIFSSMVRVEEPGEYRLQVAARLPTVERHQNFPFRVKERLVQVTVASVEDTNAGPSSQGVSKDFFRITLSPEVAGWKEVEVKLEAIDAENRILKLPVEQTSDKSLRYEIPVSRALAKEGEYRLYAKVSGIGRRKTPKKAVSSVLNYTRVIREIEEVEVVEVVLDEKEEPAGPPPLGLGLALAFLGNLGIAGYAFLTLKKTQGNATFEVPDFESSDHIVEAIAILEEKSQLTEVALNDPMFADDASAPAPPEGLAGDAAPAEVSAESSDEGSAEPAEEAEASDDAAAEEEPKPEDGAAEEDAEAGAEVEEGGEGDGDSEEGGDDDGEEPPEEG